MKAHRYQVTCYVDALALTHGMGETQDRLYISGQGVLAYRRRAYESDKQIDFFSDDERDLAEAEQSIKGLSKVKGGVKYLGEIEVPDSVVSKIVSAAKSLNKARTAFEESARTLVDLL